MTAGHPARGRLALALDVGDLERAQSLARSLRPFFAVVKIGLELWCASGPAALETLREDGFEVFADLKLHDIPTTVRRSAAELARRGARLLTVHTAAGRAALEAAVAGAAEGASGAGLPPPGVLGVTVLTSDPDPDPRLLAERAALAARSGCWGAVCAVADLPTVRAAAPGLRTVVPGIRPAGSPADDQGRPATASAAAAAGADLLVVGRAVTGAPDPLAAARRIADDLVGGTAR